MTTTISELDDERQMSLRDRKKLRTRRQLIAVSQRLFAKQGYSETTLEQICAEVEIRPQTLLRYFESKAHLALAPAYDIYEQFGLRLQDPDRPTGAVGAWRAQVEDQSLLHNRDAARYTARIQAEPVLRAMSDELQTRYEEQLATAIASDAGAEPDDPYSVLLATTLIRSNAAMMRRWAATGADPEVLATNQLAVVDFILTTFPARDSAAVATLRLAVSP
jgi:AcrR family transcriptional regulator